MTLLTACASWASAGIAKSISSFEKDSWAGSKCVGEKYPRPLFGTEAVASLVQLETDLEMRDSIRRHQQLVSVQAWQQVLGDVLVPEQFDLLLAMVALRLPLLDAAYL